MIYRIVSDKGISSKRGIYLNESNGTTNPILDRIFAFSILDRVQHSRITFVSLIGISALQQVVYAAETLLVEKILLLIMYFSSIKVES